MKSVKRLAFAVLLALSATVLSAGCLNDFNNNMYSCDSGGFGFFTRAGCRADCVVAYYSCIETAALD